VGLTLELIHFDSLGIAQYYPSQLLPMNRNGLIQPVVWFSKYFISKFSNYASDIIVHSLLSFHVLVVIKFTGMPVYLSLPEY